MVNADEKPFVRMKSVCRLDYSFIRCLQSVLKQYERAVAEFSNYLCFIRFSRAEFQQQATTLTYYQLNECNEWPIPMKIHDFSCCRHIMRLMKKLFIIEPANPFHSFSFYWFCVKILDKIVELMTCYIFSLMGIGHFFLEVIKIKQPSI